jgi:hypothetical protein
MAVEIENYNLDKAKVIERAVMDEWPFDDFYSLKENTLWSCAEDNLTGGETEQEFAKRIAAAVWKANEGFCSVSLEAAFLEAIPTSIYSFNKAQYDKLKKE